MRGPDVEALVVSQRIRFQMDAQFQWQVRTWKLFQTYFKKWKKRNCVATTGIFWLR